MKVRNVFKKSPVAAQGCPPPAVSWLGEIVMGIKASCSEEIEPSTSADGILEDQEIDETTTWISIMVWGLDVVAKNSFYMAAYTAHKHVNKVRDVPSSDFAEIATQE